MSTKMSLIDLVACEMLNVQYSFGNFCLITFQAAIVLRNIQYLRMTVHLDGDNEKDEKKSCSGLQPPAFYVAGSQASGLCMANYSL